MRRYIIPSLKDSSQPSRLCPGCNTSSGRIHQRRRLPITDTRIGQVTKLRMRCSACRLSWTCQPEGLKAHFQRSQRIRALNILFYAMGLSFEAVAQVMTSLGASESDTSVYRDLIESMQRVKHLHKRGRRKVRVAGIDATYQRLAQPHNPHHQSTIFVVDFSDGQLLEVELLDEDDALQVAALIKDLEAKYQIELWVSDEHTSYTQAIAPERHLLCTAHFKRAKLRRVKELKQQVRSERMMQDLEALEDLLKHRPEEGQQLARQIYLRQRRVRRPAKGKRASPGSRLKQLAREVYEKWERVWQTTNNKTEAAIGLCLKIRSKLMRGFKVAEHIKGFAQVRGWMYEQGDRIEMGSLL
jgi:Transposase IS66 family